MGSEFRRSLSGRSQRWLRKKSKRSEANSSADVSDSELEECLSHSFVSSREVQSSGLTHELRVFVGTWNVGGKSPMGSLAADLNEWLNVQNSVDIYVLGFQEIVPLKTMTVIGMEDYTDARKWNLLIGKTLNSKDGNIWMTPTLSAEMKNDDYQYAKHPKSAEKTGFRRSTTPMKQKWKSKHGGEECGNPTYKLMASKKLVGIFISVWMKRDVIRKYKVSNVKACTIACGLMGYLGNKGAVSVSMSIEGTSFCFTTAHLASGEKKGDESRRNQQVGEIFKRTTFPRLPQEFNDPLPPTISGHDRIFWFGDLNYRLYMDDEKARELIRKKKWKELQKFDQLKKEQHEGVFQGWKEGDVEFAPTYKYSVELGNRYTGDKHSPFNPTTGEKRRTPAWCDRIMWFGKGIQQLSYYRGESKFSDHRPVSSLFTAEIDVLGPPNSKTVALSKFLTSMNLTKFDAPTTPTTKRTLLSLIKAEAEESENENELTVDNIHTRS